MRKLIGLVIVLGLALALLSSPVVSASPEAVEELMPLLLKFEQAFETWDLEIFTELFWHDKKLTVFFPEPETAFRMDGWTQIQSYLRGFTSFVSQLPPGTVNMETRQPSINVMGDVAILTKYWVVTMLTPEGSQVMQGRGTSVWKKIEGNWVIIHMHISLFPTP
jgi:ketosteroid isomerase-like protein